MSTHPLDAVTVCHHCHAPLARDAHGHLSYWSESRPGTAPDFWPVQVKVCRDCRNKYPMEPDVPTQETRNGNR